MNHVVTQHNLLPTYARQDVTFVAGDGSWLTDSNGKRYLDLLGGIAVVGLGHLHHAPLKAAHDQLDRLWHTSNLFFTEPMEQLAARLSDRFGGADAFFCNSGTEAVEAALKWARKATGRAEFVSLEGSFHGRTLTTLAATGQPQKLTSTHARVTHMTTLPDQRSIVVGCADGELALVDTRSARYSNLFMANDAIREIVASPDGRTIAIATNGDLVHVGQLRTGPWTSQTSDWLTLTARAGRIALTANDLLTIARTDGAIQFYSMTDRSWLSFPVGVFDFTFLIFNQPRSQLSAFDSQGHIFQIDLQTIYLKLHSQSTH